MPNPKRYTPPYRNRHASDPVRTVTRTETFIDLIANNGMTEEESDKLHNPELPGDGSLRWVLGACGVVVILLLILTAVYFFQP